MKTKSRREIEGEALRLAAVLDGLNSKPQEGIDSLVGLAGQAELLGALRALGWVLGLPDDDLTVTARERRANEQANN